MQNQREGALNSRTPLAPLFTRICVQALYFQTLANSFASTENSTSLFSTDSELFRKNYRGGSRVLVPLRELCVLRGLCVNSFFFFQPSTFDREPRSRPLAFSPAMYSIYAALGSQCQRHLG